MGGQDDDNNSIMLCSLFYKKTAFLFVTFLGSVRHLFAVARAARG